MASMLPAGSRPGSSLAVASQAAIAAGSAGVPRRAREFAFSQADFNALRRLARELTGITLADSRAEMVYGRLSRRLRALGLGSFTEYRALLARTEGKAELPRFVNAITTNLTSFFREAHHFDVLREQVLRPLVESPRRLRIWSAGCSTGEEPYSIAMTVAEVLPPSVRADLRILATDLDSDVLERARSGLYREDRLEGLAPRLRSTYFTRDGKDSLLLRVSQELAAMISFRQLNLMQEFPMKGPMDVIFCRNVLIYFDKETQRQVVERFARLQRPGGLLFLGHSETLHGACEGYVPLGRTVYRRGNG